MASTQKRTSPTDAGKRAKYRKLADHAALELAPTDPELRESVARLLAVIYRMTESIVRPSAA